MRGSVGLVVTKAKSQADETRQALLTAFCDLYRENPLEKITVQSVTRKAGYNRTTFYQYFLDIEDLLRQVEESLLAYISQKRNSLSVDERPHDLIEDLVAIYEERAIEVNALLGPYGRVHFTEKLKKSLDLSAFHLDSMQDNKYQPYLLEFRLTSALNLFSLWLSRGQDLSVEELIGLVTKLYHYNPGFQELAEAKPSDK